MISNVDVLLPQGTVRGVRNAAGSARFSAIPYARPPVGRLRFHPPEPAGWSGVLDATRDGTVPPQLPSRLGGAIGDMPGVQSEDCLHLTVWTPAADRARRPVVVWIHGGAWQSGAGAVPWYDGSRLANEGDVVVVAVNYRVAALGWLSLPGLTSNLGLLDQEAALDWVVRNIEHFGGDPARITAMGQSAGASCIAALLGRAPRFRRAILQSGVLGKSFRNLEEAHELGGLFLDAAGVSSVAELAALPVEALLAAQQAPALGQAMASGRFNGPLFTLVADGVVLPREMNARVDQLPGMCDVLVGHTRDEMAAFPGFGRDERSQAAGEARFGGPARKWAESAHEAGRSSWLYRVDVAPSDRFGACHCIELPFVFGTLDAFASAPMLSGLSDSHAAELSRQMRLAWLRFIRGEPLDWDMAPAMRIFE